MKIRTRIPSLLGCLAVLLFSTNASAIGFDVVEGADDLLSSGFIANSNPDTEEAFIEAALAALLGGPVDITYTKLADSSDEFWDEVTGEPVGDLYAFDLKAAGGAEYFVIKTGNTDPGSPPDPSSENIFLYDNLISLQYAVIDLDELPDDFNIGRVSHTGATGSTGGPTPVPDGGATLILLGAALSGLGMARRFMSS
jgi:VPDSG-CTERM motif